MKTRKNRKWNSFLQKMRFRYRVSIMNENTLEEAWYLRLSRFSVFIYVSFLIFLTFTLLALVIIYTPLKYYLPGYGNPDERLDIINKTLQIDSLLHQMEIQSTYLDMVKGIVTGDLSKDSLLLSDSISLENRAEVLMEKSKAEREFVEKYEEEEKYNLSALVSKETKSVFVFFKPTKGVITSSFNPKEKAYGISMVTTPHETVVSVLSGTVIYTSYSLDYGWVMQVQHEENYLSIYKFNTQLLKKVGDYVKAGEAIAFTGDDRELKTGNHFYFELWQQGKAINPEEMIIF